MINGKHSQEKSYDGRTHTKKFMFSKRQRSLLHARSTLGTPCEQGSGCAAAVTSLCQVVEEFPWYLFPLVLSICACSPGAGQRIGSTGDWTAKGFHVEHHHMHCEKAWCFPLGASECNSSVLWQNMSVIWPGVRVCFLQLCHTACRISCMDVQKKEKSADLY